MTKKIESLKQQIDRCTTEEKRLLAIHLNRLLGLHPLEAEWGIDSETILNAIQRASDLTKRGVRGIIAEAIFVNRVVPIIADSGWSLCVMDNGDFPYDALLQKGKHKARIQIKLQRLEKGIPKRYYPKQFSEDLYVVEVQKTRSGKRQSKFANSSEVTTESTRPYRFGDFDILAVNMHPSTHEWTRFQYTVANWLIPRGVDKNLIEIFQPVPLVSGNAWTDNLVTCLDWLLSGKEQKLLGLDASPKAQRRIRTNKQ